MTVKNDFKMFDPRRGWMGMSLIAAGAFLLWSAGLPKNPAPVKDKPGKTASHMNSVEARQQNWSRTHSVPVDGEIDDPILAIRQVSSINMDDPVLSAWDEPIRESTQRADDDQVLVADNHGHGLSIGFFDDGMRLSVSRGDLQGMAGLHLTQAGWEKNTQAISKGNVSSQNNRVEIQRGSITEWYLNTPRGLEQGFIVHAAPEGNGDRYVLEMDHSGSFKVDLIDEDTVSFKGNGLTQMTYSGLVAFDRQGRELPAELTVPEPGVLRISVDAGSDQFPILIDPILSIPAETISSDNGFLSDAFGETIAANDQFLCVRSPYNVDPFSGLPSGTVTNAGVVTVYERVNDNWVEMQVLEPSVLGSNDFFGWDMALDGDTLVIGAPQKSNVYGIARGEVFVYELNRTAGTWDLTQTLTLQNTFTKDYGSHVHFGFSLDVEGDMLVVGAPRKSFYQDEPLTLSEPGLVITFNRNGSGFWVATQEILSPFAGPDLFGQSLDLDGGRLAVGGRDTLSPGLSGVVSTYSKNSLTGEWEYFDMVRSLSAGNSRFGAGVSLSGDRLAVSSPLSSVYGHDSVGLVFVYAVTDDDTSAWHSPKVLAPSGTDTFDLGARVELEENTIIVGTVGGSSGSVNQVALTFHYDTLLDQWIRSQDLSRAQTSSSSSTTYASSWGSAVALWNGRYLVGDPKTDDEIRGVVLQFAHDPFFDVNGDGIRSITDILYLINYLLIPGSPAPAGLSDANLDGITDFDDVDFMLDHLFNP